MRGRLGCWASSQFVFCFPGEEASEECQQCSPFPSLATFRGENSFYVRFLETDSRNLLKRGRRGGGEKLGDGAFYRRRSLTSRQKAAGI